MIDRMSPLSPSGQAAAAERADPAAAKAAHQFEAVFIGQMTKIMMETVQSDGPFSGGHGEEMFRGMLGEQLGTVISARGGIGLAPAVMDQIIKLQGGGNACRRH